jgi:hypothetical protein
MPFSPIRSIDSVQSQSKSKHRHTFILFNVHIYIHIKKLILKFIWEGTWTRTAKMFFAKEE